MGKAKRECLVCGKKFDDKKWDDIAFVLSRGTTKTMPAAAVFARRQCCSSKCFFKFWTTFSEILYRG